MVKRSKIEIRNLDFSYGGRPVLRNISADFFEHTVTAVTGPSGNGKSTLLTVLNRLWEENAGAKMSGSVKIRFRETLRDIHHPSCEPPMLRRRVGMVFQNPNPLPMSIYRNVAFPLKLAGIDRSARAGEMVEKALRRAYLWEEVKERLHGNALDLSGGQQQRLCIARTLVLEPEVLLLDEPTSSLDPRGVEMIEELLTELANRCTIILVSHYLSQVTRIADRVFELSRGELSCTARGF